MFVHQAVGTTNIFNGQLWTNMEKLGHKQIVKPPVTLRSEVMNNLLV